MPPSRRFALALAAAGAILAAASIPSVSAAKIASIAPLTLRQMLERADSAVAGSIVEKRVWRGPLEGFDEDPEFTTIVVRGEDWIAGGQVDREVTYLGSEARPVSDMPAESETRVGTRVVAFSKTVGAWGGRAGQRSLIAAQGGVFRIEAGPKGDVVLGKGEGFAVADSAFATDLRARVARELVEIRRKR
ncbi:MAG TPA: hypothetical protein VKE69_10625 [Planctomycetota bacterium]|nr:hypothetical protein [Planctomycetota bacterium]